MQRREDEDKERGGVLGSIGEVRECFPGVPVAPETLGEAEPARQARHHRAQRCHAVHALVSICNQSACSQRDTGPVNTRLNSMGDKHKIIKV